MICITMFVNDYTMSETTRTSVFSVFSVRSDNMKRANCDLCDEGCASLSESDVGSCLITHCSICRTRINWEVE